MLQNDNKAKRKNNILLKKEAYYSYLITCKSKLMISLLCFEKQELGREDFFCEIRADEN